MTDFYKTGPVMGDSFPNSPCETYSFYATESCAEKNIPRDLSLSLHFLRFVSVPNSSNFTPLLQHLLGCFKATAEYRHRQFSLITIYERRDSDCEVYGR